MSPLAELLERQSVLLVEATIPADMTVAEWRRRRMRGGRPAPRAARPRRLGWRPRLQQGGPR
jgi:hypothetical protein